MSMIRHVIHIVDDERTIREGISMALEEDYRIKAFADAETALESLNQDPPDLLLLDIGLPGISGIDALQAVKQQQPEILVIMITAYEDIDTVIATMKAGAYDYIVKPIHMDTLAVTIGNALDTIRLRKEVRALQEKHLTEHLPCFIGESEAIQNVMEFIRTVAKSPDTPVLITGETGTGKELLAGAIHYNSPNFKGPLATVNCAAIARELIESELFGYEKGAFSGAGASGKKGLIEEAAGGTLFLDEVGDLSPEAQAKLLRFLENGEFCRVGGTRKLHLKTRVISATNKQLNQMMETGRFRKDLYYRLGVIKVQVPSLSQRPADILPLTKHFLQEFSQKFGKQFTGISTDAEKALMSHAWKGNVRELKNLIEAAVLTGKGPQLTLKDLDIENKMQAAKLQPEAAPDIRFRPIPAEGMDLDAELHAFEKFYIQEALKIANGNESKAARMLNINHHTFRYRHRKLLPE